MKPIACRARGILAAAAVATVFLSTACEREDGSAVATPATTTADAGGGAGVVCLDGEHFPGTEPELVSIYDNAIHLEFKTVPVPVVREIRANMRSGENCVLPLRPLLESPNPFVRSIAHAARGGTIEPSFGCDVIPAEGSRPSPRRLELLRYWTVRYRPEELLGPGGEAAKDERLRALSKDFEELHAIVQQALPAPLVRPPQSLDPLVGQSAENEVGESTPCGTQWYLHEIRVTDVWNTWPALWPLATGKGPVVAIIDFGFREHAELSGVLNLAKAHNSCDDSTQIGWGERVYHGTAVAGLLASRRDGAGIVGVAHGAEVWPVQATCETRVAGDPWAKAVLWAHEQDAGGRPKVVLLEVEAAEGWDIEEANINVRRAVADAVADGIVVIVAAGNGTKSTERNRFGMRIDPTGSILVGATAYTTKELADFSNYGERVVVSAPGDGEHDLTLSDRQGVRGYVRRFGGTSGAAPKVAGVVMLMLTENDRLKPQDVRDILSSVGRDLVGRDGKPSGKALDAFAAVEEARRRRGGS